MKKLLKIIGYTFLTLIVVCFLALVTARFLAPVIVEKALVKDISEAGFKADVNVEIDKFGPFGIDIPEVKISLGEDEIALRNVVVDVESLFQRNHELIVNLGDLHVKVTDNLLTYLNNNGVPSSDTKPLRGVNLTIDMASPFFVADKDDIYLDVRGFRLGFFDNTGVFNEIETDGFKATANMETDEFIVTPFTVYGNGEEILTFDEGIYSDDMENFRGGQVRIHKFQGLPEGKIGEMQVHVTDDVVYVTSEGIELSEMDGYEDFFDRIITDPVSIEIRDRNVLLDTVVYFSGEKKLLDNLGFDVEVIAEGERIEVTDGTILHRKFKKTIPFALAIEGNDMEVEIAGSKRWNLDMVSPSEETIGEMISFVLVKLASSIFGL